MTSETTRGEMAAVEDGRPWDLSATYSPEDNKLRVYSLRRLDADTYARVRAAGFIRAPKQDCFVAPAWTPERADLLIELCGEIGDEDTSLVDRAEDRVERFGGYRENRLRDAERARAAVSAIADNIPLGQPILVGHHSERHARRDAKRIEHGMRRALQMWDTAQYWQARAAAARGHAAYKERPAVRHRRIKTLDAERRRHARHADEARAGITRWAHLNDPYQDGRPCDDALRRQRATTLAHESYHPLPATPERPAGDSLGSAVDRGRLTPRAAQVIALNGYARVIAHAKRWTAHLDHRLAYERAMLAEDGGIAADRWPIEPGGRVLVREWLVVLRINHGRDGAITSVTHVAPRGVHWQRTWTTGIEDVRDYRPPAADDAARVRAALKKPPLCNYPGDSVEVMTKAAWERIDRDYKSSQTITATATAAAHRVRSRLKGFAGRVFVYVSDLPRKDPPPARPSASSPDERDDARADDPATVDRRESGEAQPCLPDAGAVRARDVPTPTFELPFALTPPHPPPARDAARQRELFEGLRDQLRAGVTAVAAPQLFPTPPALADRMVALAQLARGDRILEPSAGTGRLIDAILSDEEWSGTVVAVEINPALASRLRATYRPESVAVHCCDCLAHTPADLGLFDVVLMNPPFGDAQDITHIRHALTFLRPGGRLVALCANGPRQQAKVRPYVEGCGGSWEELPADTFAASGTSVRAVLIGLEPRDRCAAGAGET